MSRFREILAKEAADDGEVPDVVEKIAPKGKKKLKKKLKKPEGAVNIEVAPPLEAEDDGVAPADGAHFKEAILADQRTRALELAEEFLSIEEELTILKERIGRNVNELMPLVRALGGDEKEIVLPDGRRVVITTTGGGRRATMKGIIEQFGAEGKEWWDALKPAPGYDKLEGRGPRTDQKKRAGTRRPKP